MRPNSLNLNTESKPAPPFADDCSTRASTTTCNRDSILSSDFDTVSLPELPRAAISLQTVDTTSSTVIEKPNAPRVEPLSIARLFMAHIGAALTLFLATTDATIVSTSLPTISADLSASQTQYTWVGVAYMLTQTACQPLYGRISDLVGRKNLLYASVTIFAAGSLLCGAAKTINWLIISRAFAGIGGGGIVSSVWVITSEIVAIENRAKWSQALSITWSCSAVAGPLLGGVFSSGHRKTLNWRWAFYLNLPICIVGLSVLHFSLKGIQLQRSPDASWRRLARRFDFVGLVLFMGGTSCIVLGLSFATQVGWSSPSTIILVLLGVLVLVTGSFYEIRTTKDALFPVTAFKDLDAVITLLITFLHNLAFTAGTFYLALYNQAAKGASPLEAGLLLLPYSLGSSLASMPVAWFIGYRQRKTLDTSGQKLVVCVGLFISTIGFGLLILLNEHSSASTQTLFPLVAGIGLGMLFHAPYQLFTRTLKSEELATGTSAFFLVRFTGATTGLAIAGAIFNAKSSGIIHDVPLPGLGSGFSVDYSRLGSVQPLSLRWEVLRIVSTSIQTIWMVCCPCLGVAFLMSFLLHNTSTAKKIIPESNSDTEGKEISSIPIPKEHV